MTVRRGVGVRALLGPAVLVALAVGGRLRGRRGGRRRGLGAGGRGAGGRARRWASCWSASCRSCRPRGAAAGWVRCCCSSGTSAQVLLLVVVLAVVTTSGTPDPTVLGLTVIAVALGWTAGTVWSWLRWRGPVVDVGASEPTGGTRAR